MSVDGRFDQIQPADVHKLAERFGIERPAQIIEQVDAGVANWSTYTREAVSWYPGS